jgi:hypothetical protein
VPIIASAVRFAALLIMSVAIRPVTVVANRVPTPVAMVSFPTVEALQSERLATYPDIPGAQVKIISPNHADIFISVPHITVGNIDRFGRRRRSRGNYYGRGRCHDHPSAWLNHAAGHD